MATLKTDYKDDILDTSQNTKRKYAMTENQDNTVSFDDETEYTQEGDSFGAQDINATNAQVNTNTDAIDTINNNLSGFCYYPSGTAIVGLVADDSAYTDADGNYILANSTTGQGMIDNVTYKSINSTEDTRGEVGADTAIPFSKVEEPTLLKTLSQNANAPYANFTLNGNISKFKYLVFKFTRNLSSDYQKTNDFYDFSNEMRYLATDLFASGTEYKVQNYASNGITCGVYFKYINDTTIACKSQASGYTLSVFGTNI